MDRAASDGLTQRKALQSPRDVMVMASVDDLLQFYCRLHRLSHCFFMRELHLKFIHSWQTEHHRWTQTLKRPFVWPQPISLCLALERVCLRHCPIAKRVYIWSSQTVKWVVWFILLGLIFLMCQRAVNVRDVISECLRIVVMSVPQWEFQCLCLCMAFVAVSFLEWIGKGMICQ